MIEGNNVIKTHKLGELRFYGDEFVFNTVSGMCYRLTSTAGFLLRALIDGATNDQLIGLIQSRYGIERAVAVRDVELWLNDMAELGILD